MEIRRVSLDELFAAPNWRELCDGYAAEAANPEFGEWKLNEGMYRSLEASGKLVALGVYEGDKLVGFIGGAVVPQSHFSDCSVFAVDAAYLAPEHRKAFAGLRMLRLMKVAAKEMGANGIMVGARLGTRAYELYSRIFKPMNTLFWSAV